MSNPINGLVILELAGVLAGPAVGMFFAELGARVIKIENSQNPDVTRSWKLPSEDKNSRISGYFSSVNYAKEYLECDLNNEDDRQQFYTLANIADIIITNFRNPQKLGIDYEYLKQLNPRLIYANITGYGEASPRGAYDAVLQAESGLMSINGMSESDPLKLPVAFIDILAAHQLKQAILLALLKRNQTNYGSYLSISLYETAISSLANQATNWLMAGEIPKQTGSLHPTIAPYGETIACQDGKYIVLAIGNDKQFYNLCKILELEELVRNEKFVDNISRVKNRQELNNHLLQKFKTRPAHEWRQIFIEKEIPAGQVLGIHEVFEEKIAKSMILTEKIEEIKTRRVKTVAFDTAFLNDC